jgi:hypothetical protein
VSWTIFQNIQTIAIQLASINQPSIGPIAVQRIGRHYGFLEQRLGEGLGCSWFPMAVKRAQPTPGVQFRPDQSVLHGDRRATLIRISGGAAIIRYRGDSHAVSVPLESLTLPPPKPR